MTDLLADEQTLPRANILGVGVHALNMTTSVKVIETAITTDQRGYVCATGVHGIMEAQRNRSLRTIFAKALLVVPDGMPTVWMGRLQGLRHMRRVFGPDLMLAVLGAPTLQGCSHFLYGGDEGVAQQLAHSLRHRFPNAQIVGTYTPPFRPLNDHEDAELCALVDHLQPDIIWIGLSTPKQERFMAEYLLRLNTTLMIGVGAAFDYHTGRLKDSPQWVKQLGLQWLHRLLQEPARLWKRYLVNNPAFLALAILQLTGLRRFGLGPAPLGHRQSSRPHTPESSANAR